MHKKDNTRRKFIKKSTLAGLSVLSMPLISDLTGSTDSGSLNVQPRYHSWMVDPGEEWLETNTGYSTLDWHIPLSQTAIVLVDVWQRHYLKDTEERGEIVITNKLVPLLEKARQVGMPIIHAPSPPVARRHANWVKLLNEHEMVPSQDDWPPKKFRSLEGKYEVYSRPFELREAEMKALPSLSFHPKVQPVGSEAVITTGEELHRYCKKEEILFLFFAGFNTNACILSRDYGTMQMRNRGYQVILIRDCTTGMESPETQPTLAQTRGAILQLEMFGHYSITSDEISSGFSS